MCIRDRRIRPERFYDLVVQVAIIRPGPIVGNMVHPYIRRRRGREPVTYPHPSLEPILRRTLGVPLFQEQLLRMAMVAAGFSGSEAEELRRAFGFKRSEARMAEVEQKLRAGMARQGIDGAAAEEIVHAITAFALYGFPECVVGETRVLDADTGSWARIEDIVAGRVRIQNTLACDAQFKLRRRRVLGATSSGSRMVYRLRTALGRELLATAEHPLLTADGWRALAALRPGDHIAAARALPRLGEKRWPRHQVIVLADLIAEGNLCHPSTFYFYTVDPRHCAEFVEAVERFDNTRATIARHHNCYSVHVRRRDPSRPIGAVLWAKELGIWGCNAHGKRLPDAAFELRTADVALLLAHLWEGDGSLSDARHVSYDTVSRPLAEGVQHLLLQLGIVARIYERNRRYRDRYVESFVVTVTGWANLRRFSRLIARRFLDPDKRRRAKVLTEAGHHARMSRDVIPVGVKAAIDRERARRGVTWDQLREGGRLARYFDSPQLKRLAESDLYWDRVTAIEPVGSRETYDLHIEGDHNFLANDLVVHNSHASSFALLAYASAFLRVHHPAAFYAALLNNQPMGFYHAATIVKDAQRHGLRILPIDVTRSAWLCTIEQGAGTRAVARPHPAGIAREVDRSPGQSPGQPSVRLGLRYVKGLRESAGRAIVAAHVERPFGSMHDLARRAGLTRDELVTLAATGALASLGGTRRANLWAAALPPAGPLYATVSGDAAEPRRISLGPLAAQAGLAAPVTVTAGLADPATTERGAAVRDQGARDPSPLREMTVEERLHADYAGTGVTLGPHPIALRRRGLAASGVLSAADLLNAPDGLRVRVAGSVIVRQRPGTAKGFVFLSLEDETGIANVIVTPQLFARNRLTLVTEPFLLVEGTLQTQDGVVSIRVQRVQPLARLGVHVPSHDFG